MSKTSAPEFSSFKEAYDTLRSTAAELRAQAEAAETRERAEAEARAAREAEYERLHREADRIAAETMPVYDAIAATVDSLLPGLGPLARQLEDAEAAAMAQGNAVDPEQGAAEVQGRLRRHRAERLRRFLDLLRDDGPARDQ